MDSNFTVMKKVFNVLEDKYPEEAVTIVIMDNTEVTEHRKLFGKAKVAHAKLWRELNEYHQNGA